MILGWFTALLAAAPIKIAVMELRADGGADPVIARQLAARVAEVAGKHAGSIIAPDDLRALLEQESKKQGRFPHGAQPNTRPGGGISGEGA